MPRFSCVLCVVGITAATLLVGCSGHTHRSADVTAALQQAARRPAIPGETRSSVAPRRAWLDHDGPIFTQAAYLVSAADNDSSAHRSDKLEPLPSFSEILTRDIKALPRSLWDDTKRVYSDKTNLAVLLLAGGASLAVRNTVDDDFEDHFDKHRSLRGDWDDFGSVAGNPGLHFAVAAAAYAYGAKTGDAKTYHVGKTLINALAINGLSTMFLKVAANTSSPNGENLAWPSGHTSSTVCLAAVLDEAYGHAVGWPLYALSGFVAFERMDDREHHFSDIVFGAVLGYVVGTTAAKGHQPEFAGGQIIPYVDPYRGTSGLAWVKGF